MKRVLVILPLKEGEKEYLVSQTLGAEEEFVFSFHETVSEASEEEIASANVIIGRCPAGRMKDAKSLEWMHLQSAGADAYVAPGVLPEHVQLTNSAGAYGLAVSEHILAMTLALIRRFPQYLRNQCARSWKPMGEIISIEGSTVAVLGLGDIGGRYAKMMKALGAHVIGIRRTDRSRPEYVDEQYTMAQLREVVGRADIVAMILPGSKETEKLMDCEMLHAMKKGSYLINCGRGNAVDLAALREALDDGHLAGAALDVTEPEPLPADDPLWGYDNVLITPHVAGNFYLPKTFENVIRIAGENLGRYAQREPLGHVVNRRTGY